MKAPNESAPSPQLFLETVNAYHRTAILEAATGLDLFTAIGEGLGTPQELAERCQASERGLRILCDSLTAMGFLRKSLAGAYALTADSATFLDRCSPAYLGDSLQFLLGSTLRQAYQGLGTAVRKGGTALGGEGTMEPDHAAWVEFARGMGAFMALPAELLARCVGVPGGRPRKVLDVAAGHGLFGLTFAKLDPAVTVYAVDWAAVLEVARENAARLGLGERFHSLPGSVFTADLGSGYDLILLPNFLHHFDRGTCTALLARLSEVLAPAGQVATLEFIPNEDRVTPPPVALFAMTMLATTAAGDAYTFAEYAEMFEEAGFTRNVLHELPPTLQRAIVSSRE